MPGGAAFISMLASDHLDSLLLDFANFADAPGPVPEPGPSSITPTNAAAAAAISTSPVAAVPYTRWYRVHERHSLSEFWAEGIILAISALLLLLHLIGARANRSRARAWIRANAPVLAAEFALVGFGSQPTMDADIDPDLLLEEKSLFEFTTYATGRQNVAFIDVKISLPKRFNPIMSAIESATAFFSDSATAPVDAVEVSLYPFDGKESLTVPSAPGPVDARASKESKSTYDGFVWAIVKKDCMRGLRDDRYDVTLTSTKDHSKLPKWLTVMSENGEITDALLTPDLITAVVDAGSFFDYLIVSDQPATKPRTLDEATPRKRLFLRYRLPLDGDYSTLIPLLSCFLRLPDRLVQSAHFRPEVLKKVRATREAVTAQIRKAAEEERNEERMLEKEKARKAKREAELKALDAKAQKKYLEKEKEKEQRKNQKRLTMRG